MIGTFQNIARIPELRRRILFTLGILAVYRLGAYIPTPGINAEALAQFMQATAGTLFGLYDLFVGGAFQNAAVFALGIMPYISASIIMQLIGTVIPFIQRLQKEGEEGRRKITQYTRYGTVLIAIVQSLGMAVYLEGMNSQVAGVVPHPGLGFKLLTMLTMTSGTIFIMWLGEQINDKGIGNGISLIIFIGIIARLPQSILDEGRLLLSGQRSLLTEVAMIALIVIVIASVVLVTRAQRRIPVQYAKRVVGRRIYGGQATHLPLSVNTAGIIPIIFAQSIMFAPSTLTSFFPNSAVMQDLAMLLNPGGWLYSLLYALLIVFFAYFPVDLADNMRKNGGFIPGVRPGKNTSEYIDRVLTRITLPGAIFFAVVAILPYFLISSMGVQFYFGGTSILIVVGVALDTLQQIESHLLMRHYEGFMKKGRIRGRSF
jgi:preprotein translocase subunit SecY